MSHAKVDISYEKDVQIEDAQTEKIRMFPMFQFRYNMRCYLAEYFGCTVMLIFGSSIIANITFNAELGSEYWLLIAFGWCFAVTMALYVSMGNSGGHLNSAVTISAAVFGRFPWKMVPGYLLAQFLGCITGSAITYGVWKSRFDAFDGGKRQTTGEFATASIFATYPMPTNSTVQNFFTEMLCGTLLLFVLQGIFDHRMMPAKGFEQIAVGFLIFIISVCFGKTSGSSMNPARDFGPRVFTAMAGWGSEPFTAANHYFWVPIVAPICGGILGTGLYEFFIIPNLD
ncbi:hypothetical protein BB559_005166 [Furculomyces boomerangus]|uniref:Aquaporin n=2 Tax=Harpellales TaxID=61421 RepID=A0A2T9YAB6_9FUNG|nr:hypothetical protein BB559_005166 [Furculomyces boomerangus]PVZ98979.1 hypothetical protein BB558_005007 [Smittium angustum]